MLKKITSYEYCGACRYTGYENKSIRLHLECGHSSTRKASSVKKGIPKKARCRHCDYEAAKRWRLTRMT